MGNFEYLLNLTYPVRGFGLWELITAASANLIIELLESQDRKPRSAHVPRNPCRMHCVNYLKSFGLIRRNSINKQQQQKAALLQAFVGMMKFKCRVNAILMNADMFTINMLMV